VRKVKIVCDVCGAKPTQLVLPNQPASLVLVHTVDCIRGAGGWYIDVDDKMSRVETLKQ
jgi:hypothetical protein